MHRQFWELPESSEDVFSLFSPADIRRTRDNARENLGTLILAVTSRLFILRHHPSFPDPELAPERDALNCIRVITRLLPFVYEKEALQPWEEKFFWGQRRKRTRRAAIASEVLFDESQEAQVRPETVEFEDARPLAEELIDTLIDLLFFSDLTVPAQPQGKPKVSYTIWQSGVGCNVSIPTKKEHESNRCEILRLLLTLCSQSMYMSPSFLPQKGTRALTHICSSPDKQVVLSVLCSLLNTVSGRPPQSPEKTANSRHLDPEIQPSKLAGTVQHVGVQRPEAGASHVHLAVSLGCSSLPHTRTGRMSYTKELLSPFPRTVAPTSRLPVHCRWHDADTEPALASQCLVHTWNPVLCSFRS